MATNIGISDKNRLAVGKILNTTLADEFVLYTKLRNYHWNVVSPNFSELHKFFESQYEAIDDAVDEVAERARAIGERSAGSMREFIGLARLKEEASRSLSDKSMLKNILSDHEALIRNLRKDVQTSAEKLGDVGTSDFLTGLMEEHEKMAWMTRAFLEAR
jgi:starvation-inducible DNA-binding protein